MRLKQVLFSTIILALCLGVSCQKRTSKSLTEKQQKTVDSLTSHWNQLTRPGGTIGILQNDEILYVNAFGLADIELDQKLTTESGFQLAQLSDCFIAYALLKLEADGQLSLNDNLEIFLPYIGSLSEDIKVKHLLQQASGIHDFEILKNIIGWKDDSPFSINDALDLIKIQKEPSFTPGTEFSNSRSNMLLATQVIESATKMSLSEYLHQELFQPLGMKDTFVLTSENQKYPLTVQSYQVDSGENVNPLTSKKENYASINIVSSISDMAKWELNLQSPLAPNSEVVKKFNSFVKLDNGAEYKVPEGKLTYGQKYIHKERGINTAMVTGGIDGFASAIFNFPTEDFTVITLSNNGEPYNGYIGMLSAHEILGDAFIEPSSIDFGALQTIDLDPDLHGKYEGMYWDGLGELSREIRIENDTMRYIRSNGFSTALIPLSENGFQMLTEFDDKIILEFNEAEDGISMQYFYGEATPFDFVKYQPKTISPDVLRDFEGDYSCTALGIDYSLKTWENQLVASNDRIEDISFTFIKDVIFQGDKWFLGSIEFEVSEDGEILGFYVRNDAIRNLWFEKRKL